MHTPISVSQFERSPVPGEHSIERLFGAIRSELDSRFEVKTVRCPTPRHSRVWLFTGSLQGLRCGSRVNHIVGDVHYVALALSGPTTILTVHDLFRLDHLKGWRRILYRWLYFSLPLRRCGMITVISEATRDRLLDLFPRVAGKIRVIYDCVPPELSKDTRPFNAIRPRILQIGTKENKNLERIIEAVSGLDCTLHIVGAITPYQRKRLLEREVQYENSINVTDADIARFYRESDLVVFVSLCEGFGMPIVEAQAVGRAVITSNLSPMKEVAGGAAMLVDPFDVSSIRAAILRLMEDESLRTRLITDGLKNAQRFSAKGVADLYAQAYIDVYNATSGRQTPHAPHPVNG